MGACINHPDRETRFICSKHQIYLCEDCLQCKDPDIFCKFRTSCPIWFIHKEQARQDKAGKAEEEETTLKVAMDSGSKSVDVSDGSAFVETALK